MKTTTLISVLLVFLIFIANCQDQVQQNQQIQQYDQEQDPDQEYGQDEEQDQQEYHQIQTQQEEQDQDQEYDLEQVSDFEQKQGWRKKLTKDNGARATFYRDQLKLTIQFGREKVTVNCMAFHQPDQNKPGGATPKGFYLIGKQRINQQILKLPWFNLYRLMGDKSGFYGYCQSRLDKILRGQRRSCFGIHQAVSITNGCVSCYQFDKVRRILNMGHVQYNKQQFCGWLTVV